MAFHMEGPGREQGRAEEWKQKAVVNIMNALCMLLVAEWKQVFVGVGGR
jgi:hypothetical protein